MQNLVADGFGQDQTVKRSTVLFKKLPSSMTDEDLAKYNLFVPNTGSYHVRFHFISPLALFSFKELRFPF